MAAKTTLNAKNLETLGAERLAVLVMDVVEGDAARKRRARAALLEAAGGSALAAAVSKRLVTLRRSKSRVGYRKRRAFMDDLDHHRTMIVTVAEDAPAEALDLAWRFMALAGPVHARTDDSAGAVAELFAQACRDLGVIAAKAKPSPETLAEQVFDALTDANRYGEFDGLVEASSPALGPDGLAHLRDLLRGGRARATRRAGAAIHLALLQIADELGDVDGYIAEHTPDLRAQPPIAARIAERLVGADRAAEALKFLDAAEPSRSSGRREWARVRLLALEALGRDKEAQTLRRDAFERDLDADMLRAYLSRLPDFEDIEAEEEALDRVVTRPDFHRALEFLIGWPDLRRAAALVLDRRDVLDGSLYGILGPAADALERTAPLAATLLLRAMIEDTLRGIKASRYANAARNLHTCEALAGAVESWEEIAPHDRFVQYLRVKYAPRKRFWKMLREDDRAW